MRVLNNLDTQVSQSNQQTTKQIIGVDVSKRTLDVSFLEVFEKEQWIHQRVSNDANGFKEIVKIAARFKKQGDSVVVVMEASGPYCLQLAMYLHKQGIETSVVNPLMIRRFSQMKLLRAKTDKKDAQLISIYGYEQQDNLKPWSPPSEVILEIQQLLGSHNLLRKQALQTRNQLEAYHSSGQLSQQLLRILQASLRSVEKQISRIDDRLSLLTKKYYNSNLERLETIPGIGKKTAIMLIAITNNFEKFKHHKELIAYVGLSPKIHESGTSVRGKGHICKMGRSDTRKLLYMCTWAAKRWNKPCAEMYERLKAKGKPEKVIKIALANKLLKQAFALAKYKRTFDENYRGKQGRLCIQGS